jgi:hypothetical protein
VDAHRIAEQPDLEEDWSGQGRKLTLLLIRVLVPFGISDIRRRL